MKMWVGILLYLAIVCFRCEAVTHWFVTEKGMINNQIESVYNLRESYNLVTFLQQENLTKESEAIELELISQKKHIEDTEDKDHDLEKRFLQTDKDCIISEKPIEEFDLYTSTVLTLENKGIRPHDFINLKGKAKKFKQPNCTKIVDLPFSMSAYEHLKGMQTRSNVTGEPEKGLYSTLPDNDPMNKNLDKIGHYINKALIKNESSWILYDMATFYWRIKGDALMAIECARRSLHYSSRKQKDVALLNLANILHRGHHSADALILTHAALGISKDVNGLYFTLANVYGTLGEFNSSLLFYKQTLQKQPDFEAAKKRVHAIYCQRKLEAALEAQHESLQRTLSELREYQKLNDHFQSIQEKILAAQLPSDEQYEKNMNYHRHKIQNEAHKCQFREEKDNHYFVCKREPMGTPAEMFGNPLVLKENELGALALEGDNSQCVLTDNEAVLCFNFTRFKPSKKVDQKVKTTNSGAPSTDLPSSTSSDQGKISKPDSLSRDTDDKTTSSTAGTKDDITTDVKPDSKVLPNNQSSKVNVDENLGNLHQTSTNSKPSDASKPSEGDARTHVSEEESSDTGEAAGNSEFTSSSTTGHTLSNNNIESAKRSGSQKSDISKSLKNSASDSTKAPVTDDSNSAKNSAPLSTEAQTTKDIAKSNEEPTAKGADTSQADIDEERARILARQQESDRILNDPGRSYATSDDFLIVRNNRVTVMKREENAAKFHARTFVEQPERPDKMPKGWQPTVDGPYIQDEWTRKECNTFRTLPDWNSYSVIHIHPEKKGVRMVDLFNDDLGIERNVVLDFPYYQPTCVQESKLDQGDTVMDYVEGITQRGSMHNYMGHKTLTKEFLKYGLSNKIVMDEMGERVRKAWHVTKSEHQHWMIYNHAGLYWRIIGNFHQAIECFRRAVHYVPVEFGDVPLINVANLMLSIGRYNDANQLLRMALVVNKTEPLTHYLLGNVLAASGNLTLAAEQYWQALKIDMNYQLAKDAFRHIYCYVTYFCSDCEKIIPRNRKNTMCNFASGKDKCDAHEGIKQCNGDHSAIPSSCYVDDLDANTKGDMKQTTDKKCKRKAPCPCEDGSYAESCCTKDVVETSSLSDNNIMYSGSHKNSSPHTQQSEGGNTDKNRVGELLNRRHYITDGPEGVTVGLNVKNEDHTKIVKDKNGVPASVYGPKIPTTPLITDDFIKLIGQTQAPWPTNQECASFKKSNLKAYTSTWLSVHAKGISIHDYINFKTTEGNEKTLQPDCRNDLGASLLTLDHLEGIALRAELPSSSEQGLKEVLRNIGDTYMTVPEVGTKIAIALSKDRNNWIAANVASLYWRVVGNAKKAVECSRVALFSSPPEHKDLALINLMNVLHRGGFAQDAIVIGSIALELSPQLVVNYFTLANIYSSMGQFSEAIKFYEKTLQQQSDFKPAIERLKTIKCYIINHYVGTK